MRAYSQDLRERVLQAYDAGDGGYVTLSRRFRVAESTVYRWSASVAGRASARPRFTATALSRCWMTMTGLFSGSWLRSSPTPPWPNTRRGLKRERVGP